MDKSVVVEYKVGDIFYTFTNYDPSEIATYFIQTSQESVRMQREVAMNNMVNSVLASFKDHSIDDEDEDEYDDDPSYDDALAQEEEERLIDEL